MAKQRLFRVGYIYELKLGENATRAEQRYRFVIPAEYGEGCWMSDCYQVDAGHNVRPGYELPIPVHIDDTKKGVPIREFE